jgi:hypothetical protein
LKEGWPEYLIINALQSIIPARVVDLIFTMACLPVGKGAPSSSIIKFSEGQKKSTM